MTESEVDKFSLDFKNIHFSLKVCLLNNEKILFELTNKNGPEKYKAVLSLEELKDLCFVFYSYETINESLIIIKNTIEAGTIALEEKSNESKIELEFNINSDSVQYPPFIVNLLLEENNKENLNVETAAPIFNYRGDKELEAKYGNIDYDTTEVSSIVESKVKPKPMELEYIQPILQLHYPDGSTKNTPLTPTLQGADGADLNMTEEQINSIKEMINRDSNQTNVTPMKLNSKETSNTPLGIETDIGNELVNQENIQKDSPENILEKNDVYLLRTPSPSLQVNKETRNYRPLTYKSKSQIKDINNIEPSVSVYLQPNTYQRAIYSTSSVQPTYQRTIYKTTVQPTYQRSIYRTSSVPTYRRTIYRTTVQPTYQRAIYSTSSVQPTYQRAIYSTSSVQPIYQRAIYSTSSVQPTYQRSIYTTSIPTQSNTFPLYYQNQVPIQSIIQTTQVLPQSPINIIGSQTFPVPYYQNQSVYQPIQYNYSLQNQLLPQPQINNLGSQYYMNSYSQGLNTNLRSSLSVPRKLFYYPKLK